MLRASDAAAGDAGACVAADAQAGAVADAAAAAAVADDDCRGVPCASTDSVARRDPRLRLTFDGHHWDHDWSSSSRSHHVDECAAVDEG